MDQLQFIMWINARTPMQWLHINAVDSNITFLKKLQLYKSQNRLKIIKNKLPKKCILLFSKDVLN